jgi:hypothetical protein
MDIGDLFYIILAFVILIISALTQGKRKKTLLKNKPEQGDDIASLDEIKNILNTELDMATPKKESKETEKKKPIKSEKKGSVLGKTKMDEVNDDEEEDDDFDLKSAIIYSSILERKNF